MFARILLTVILVSTAISSAPSRADYSTVLFLCTGNFYRSRFAEAVFNQGAERVGLTWRARSRGLRTNLLSAGEWQKRISPLVLARLAEIGVPATYASADPVPVEPGDLSEAGLIVALSETEHRPFLEEDFSPLGRFPIRFWRIEDDHITRPEDALPEVERQVGALLRELSRPTAASTCGPELAPPGK